MLRFVRKEPNVTEPTVEEVREALKLHTPDQHSSRKPIYEAAKAWSRIAPDDNGEWPDEVVEALAKASHDHERHVKVMEVEWGRLAEWAKESFRDKAKAVLAELVRLAEGSDDAD